eukprot:5394230-Pyramimonas_sp.AAC.1
MAKRGWTMIGGPALPAEKGRASGGVCILVRSHLGSWAPDDGCLQPGRAARCYIRPSELGVIMIGTVSWDGRASAQVAVPDRMGTGTTPHMP